MAAYLIGMGMAFWLGLQTAICACPMATNIAALAFIGRRVDSPRKVLLGGLLYALGRTLLYVALAILLLSSLLADYDVSMFLHKHMSRVMGPILIVIAMVLLEMISLGFSGPGVSEKIQRRVEALGVWGALPLGVLFAASFCPLPAWLFFGGLIPLAVQCNSPIVLPLLYGIGTALPVVGFAVLIAFGAQSVGKAYNVLTQFEWWARRIAAGIFLAVGVHYSLKYSMGITPFWDPWVQYITSSMTRSAA